MLPSTMFYTHRSLLSAVILSRIQFPSPCFVCCLQCSPNQLHLWTKIASLWSLLMKIIYLHYGKSFTFDPSSLTSPSYMYQKERMSFIWPYSAWPYNVHLTRNKIPLLQNTIIDIIQCTVYKLTYPLKKLCLGEHNTIKYKKYLYNLSIFLSLDFAGDKVPVSIWLHWKL